MVKTFTPRSVCGSSQKPSMSWANSMRRYVPSRSVPNTFSMWFVTRLSWKASATASQTGKRLRFSTSKYLRVLLCNSRLPETPSREGASKGRAQDVVDGVGGEAAFERPVAVGLIGTLSAIDAFEEGLDDVLGGTLHPLLSRTLHRDGFPHDGLDLPRKNPSWRPSSSSPAGPYMALSTGMVAAQIRSGRHMPLGQAASQHPSLVPRPASGNMRTINNALGCLP